MSDPSSTPLDHESLSPAPGAAAAAQPEELQEQLQDALEHLYDYAYLQTHPLAAMVSEVAAGWNRGASLHRLLVEAIDSLKPPHGTPAHSQLWRRYRHASMRYIEGATVVRVAEELGVSERQARRDNHEALLAIASALRSRLEREGHMRAKGEPFPSRGGDQARSPADHSESWSGSGLDDEVRRIGAAEPHGLTRLEDVLASVRDTVANLAKAKGVHLRLRPPLHLPPARAERIAVRQIVLNTTLWIIGLATSGSEVEMMVEANRRELALHVSLALPEAAARELQPEAEERLTIGARLAELQGGSMQYYREGDRLGARLVLPAADLPTVLLVDDNPGMLRLLSRYLGGGAYSVIEAQTAAEAMRLAHEAQPDVITLDVMMPTTDGWELLQMLRAQPATQHIPVIVCSVLKERDLALSLGAAGFLEKPVTQDALLRALAELHLGGAG